jgi:hypothetical protein
MNFQTAVPPIQDLDITQGLTVSGEELSLSFTGRAWMPDRDYYTSNDPHYGRIASALQITHCRDL